MIVKIFLLLNLIFGACSASGRSNSGKDDLPKKSRELSIIDCLERDLTPIAVLSTALCLLPSSVTYKSFAEFKLLTSSCRILSNLSTGTLQKICSSHLFEKVPQKYRSISRFLYCNLSVITSFLLRCFIIRLFSEVDQYLAVAGTGKTSLLAVSKIKYFCGNFFRSLIYVLLLGSSLQEYTDGVRPFVKLIGVIDFISILSAIKLAQSKDFESHLPVLMTFHSYLIWVLKYL